MFDILTKVIVWCIFYCVPDMGVLSHKKLESTGACLDNRCAQRYTEKDICLRNLC